MGQPYQQNKKHIYNWVEKNRDRHNEINKLSKRRTALKHKIWKEVAEEFRQILL